MCRSTGDMSHNSLEPQAGCEEALPRQPDLVLDLPLLPTRGWRAGDWVDQVMHAHLQEPAIVGPLLAHQGWSTAVFMLP